MDFQTVVRMSCKIETFDLTKKFLVRKTAEGKRRRLSSFRWFIGHKNENQHWVIANDHINVKVKEGEIFGIIGPNGAGKTTLIKLLCGLLLPTEGTAIVDGYDIKEVQHKIIRHSVNPILTGMRFQVYRVTLRQLLETQGRYLGIEKDTLRRRIDELLDYMNLKEWAGEWPSKLSSGMMRKLELAQGFLRETPIILLDEPTAHLDPLSAREIWELLRRLSRERNKTIVLTSQNMKEIEACTDRVVLLNRGRVIALDTSGNLKKFFVSEFLINMTIDELSEALIKDIQAIPRVIEVKEIGYDDQSGGFEMGIRVPMERPPITEIVKTIIGNNRIIVSLKSQEPTLEDIFTKIERGR